MDKRAHNQSSDRSTGGTVSNQPISTLLSQVLVAFTIELDNEFEKRMDESGYPGARLSLVVWFNLIRFVSEGGIAVSDLSNRALAPQARLKFELGCLERWQFVELRPDPADARPVPVAAQRQAGRLLRDGWGSGRGIRGNWTVRLTTKGLHAARVWRGLPGEVERRWRTRFGEDTIVRLCENLQAIVDKTDLELPLGLSAYWETRASLPQRKNHAMECLSLPSLLSQLLLSFRMEFDSRSPASLPLCANTLRVLGEKPIRLGDIPRLTGGSPEMTAIGWQLKPYVAVEPDGNGSRGKTARLTALGLKAQQTYYRLVGEIEDLWKERFGQDEVRRLRESLEEILSSGDNQGPLLSGALAPAAGTVRAGHQAPALGRQDVGAAARQRMRDLAAQTELFVRDPAGALPHYPLWDMNRGFGP
jgi:hypothetical protein